MSYVKRFVAALLGLLIVVVVVGLLSKVGLGFISLAAAILAMALAWLAHYRRRRVPAWRLIPAACIGVALVDYWALGAFGTAGEELAIALIAGAVGGTFLSSGILLVIAAALGSRAQRLGLDVGPSDKTRLPLRQTGTAQRRKNNRLTPYPRPVRRDA